MNDIYVIPMLEGLVPNTSVKTLIFTPSCSGAEVTDATSHALQRLLESTTSIKRFETLAAFCFSPIIAQAITSSECVSELKISQCRFWDRNRFAELQSILRNKQNLSSLCLDYCIFGGAQIYGDITSILLRPGSPLRCFEFNGSCRSLEGAFPGVQFKNLLRAIEKSKLERFHIGSIGTLEQLQALTQSIPSMKLKELEVKFWDDEDSDDEYEPEGELDREAIRQDLLHAVKNNFSLRAVKADVLTENDEFDLFERAEDKHRLAVYANRNESLDQWVDNPVTVEQQKVWPEALSLAERAGPDALFRGLRSVLESDYVSLPGGRKRKRPQYYAPS